MGITWLKRSPDRRKSIFCVCLKKAKEALSEKFAQELKLNSYYISKKAWLDKGLCFGGEKSSHLDVTLHLKTSEMFFFLLALLGILVPWPRIEPEPPVVEVQSPNHLTTRKFPGNLFIYFWLCWVLVAAWSSPAAAIVGYSLVAVRGFLIAGTSLVVEHGFQGLTGFRSCSTWAEQLWLRCSRAQAQ